MSLIRTATGWVPLGPLPPGAVAAKQERSRMVAEMKLLCPDVTIEDLARVASNMLADVLSQGSRV
jgi:hypothetical protein